MRGIITTVALVAPLALAGAAPAAQAAPSNHVCSGDNEFRVTASGYTSCPFAFNIANTWDASGANRGSSSRGIWNGHVRSPVTHKRYSVTCYARSGWVECWANPLSTTKSEVWFKTNGS